MSQEELTDMHEYAEAHALLGRALGEEPTMNFHPTSVLAAAKRSVSRGRAWAAGGIAAGVVVVGIGGAAIAGPLVSGPDAPPAVGTTTTKPVESIITLSPTATVSPTITVSPTTGRPEPTTTRPGEPSSTTTSPNPTVTSRPTTGHPEPTTIRPTQPPVTTRSEAVPTTR